MWPLSWTFIIRSNYHQCDTNCPEVHSNPPLISLFPFLVSSSPSSSLVPTFLSLCILIRPCCIGPRTLWSLRLICIMNQAVWLGCAVRWSHFGFLPESCIFTARVWSIATTMSLIVLHILDYLLKYVISLGACFIWVDLLLRRSGWLVIWSIYWLMIISITKVTLLLVKSSHRVIHLVIRLLSVSQLFLLELVSQSLVLGQGHQLLLTQLLHEASLLVELAFSIIHF